MADNYNGSLYDSYGEALIGGDADGMDLFELLWNTGEQDIVNELASELMKTVYNAPGDSSEKFKAIRKADDYLSGTEGDL